MASPLIKNRVAIAYWAFTAIWLVLLIVFTGIFVRDGAPEEHSATFVLGLLLVFWLGGIAMARYALSKPCYFVAVNSDHTVTFTWLYPYKRILRSFEATQLSTPVVVAEEGIDSDEYFVARIELPDGTTARLAEGNDKESCQMEIDKFIKAIGQNKR